MRYNFEWDTIKAKQNLRKHKISFERAAEVFRDPLAVSIIDEVHSEYEQRWVTMGRTKGGGVLVLIHTFVETSPDECKIRIISARKASRKEIRQYEATKL